MPRARAFASWHDVLYYACPFGCPIAPPELGPVNAFAIIAPEEQRIAHRCEAQRIPVISFFYRVKEKGPLGRAVARPYPRRTHEDEPAPETRNSTPARLLDQRRSFRRAVATPEPVRVARPTADHEKRLAVGALQSLACFTLLCLLRRCLVTAFVDFLLMPAATLTFLLIVVTGLATAWRRGGTTWKGRLVRVARRRPAWRPAPSGDDA